MRVTVTEEYSVFNASSLLFLSLLAATTYYTFTVWKTPMVWLGGVSCAIALIGYSHSVLRKSILLRFDEHGVFDRRLGVGTILWQDIEDVQLQVTEENRFLCFRLRNPEPYLARLKGDRREKILYQHSLGMTGFNVEVARAEVSLLQLKTAIDTRLRQNRS